jgi:hypothetical protein
MKSLVSNVEEAYKQCISTECYELDRVGSEEN